MRTFLVTLSLILAFVMSSGVPAFAASSPSSSSSLSSPSSHSASTKLKGYVYCLPAPGSGRTGGYYYNVEPGGKRGLLDTLQQIADSYKLHLDDVVADNPLVTVDQILPLGMSICIPYGYTG